MYILLTRLMSIRRTLSYLQFSTSKYAITLKKEKKKKKSCSDGFFTSYAFKRKRQSTDANFFRKTLRNTGLYEIRL